MIILYENIKKFRKQMQLSQEELARRTGYSDRSSIAKIEKGVVDLSQTKIQQFADVFGVSASELMGWDVNEEEQKKNDIQADIILKMRTDSTFMSVVEKLYKLDPDKLESINQMLNTLFK